MTLSVKRNVRLRSHRLAADNCSTSPDMKNEIESYFSLNAKGKTEYFPQQAVLPLLRWVTYTIIA